MSDLLTPDARRPSTSRRSPTSPGCGASAASASAPAMADKGIDALVLLSNANVSYATGASWPLSDAGRGNVERPVAVVLADDDAPHLFTPFVDDAADELGLDDDHLHGPTYLDVDEGVAAFADVARRAGPRRRPRSPSTRSPGRCTTTATLLLRRLAAPGGERGHERRPGWSRPPTSWPASATRCWITEQAMAEVQADLVPGARQTDLTATFLHRVFELGAEANVLDPIWQVMPNHQADLPWTVHGDIACPLLSTERALAAGRRALGRLGHQLPGLPLRLRPHLGGRRGARPPASRPSTRGGRRSTTPSGRSCGPASPPPTSPPRPPRSAAASGRGWRTSTSATGSASTAPRRPTSAPTSATPTTDRLVLAGRHRASCIEPVVWDEGHSGYRSENVYVITEDGA